MMAVSNKPQSASKAQHAQDMQQIRKRLDQLASSEGVNQQYVKDLMQQMNVDQVHTFYGVKLIFCKT